MDILNIDEQGQAVLPQPEDLSRRSKEDAMGSYLMMFAAVFVAPIPLINVLGGAIYYAIFRKKDRFAAFHAYQSLLSQIMISLLNLFAMGLLIIRIYRFAFGSNLTEDIEISFSQLWNVIFAEQNIIYLLIAFFVLVLILNIFYMVYSLVAASGAYKGRLFYMPFFGPIAYDKFYGRTALKKQSSEPTNSFVNRAPKHYHN